MIDFIVANDIAVAFLERATRDKFGKDAVADIDHALGAESEADIDKAKAEVTSTHADLAMPDGVVIGLIKEGDAWRINVDGPNGYRDGMTPETVKVMTQFQKDLRALADRLTGDVQAGKYKTATELTMTAKDQLNRITPKELKADAPQAMGATSRP